MVRCTSYELMTNRWRCFPHSQNKGSGAELFTTLLTLYLILECLVFLTLCSEHLLFPVEIFRALAHSIEESGHIPHSLIISWKDQPRCRKSACGHHHHRFCHANPELSLLSDNYDKEALPMEKYTSFSVQGSLNVVF